MNNIIKGLILLSTCMLLLSSCKSTRPMIKAPLKEEGPDYLYSKLKESELKFEWLSLKFDASYTEKRNKTDFKGQIRRGWEQSRVELHRHWALIPWVIERYEVRRLVCTIPAVHCGGFAGYLASC